MNIIQPYADNLLFETIVPIILVTANDAELFRNEPIEFIRRLECVTQQENDFSVRYHMLDLLYGLCSYKVNKQDDRPLYLGKFLEFCLSNLT